MRMIAFELEPLILNIVRTLKRSALKHELTSGVIPWGKKARTHAHARARTRILCVAAARERVCARARLRANHSECGLRKHFLFLLLLVK